MELLTQFSMREEYFRVLAEENALKSISPIAMVTFLQRRGNYSLDSVTPFIHNASL